MSHKNVTFCYTDKLLGEKIVSQGKSQGKFPETFLPQSTDHQLKLMLCFCAFFAICHKPLTETY